MREIKFRGHTVPFEEEDYKYEGEWVYGYFHLGMGNTYHIIEPRFKEGLVVGISYPGKNVVPESVGEFTGLVDKNGKEIYEGDIVKVSPENIRPRIVVWDQGAFHFRVPDWVAGKEMPSYPIWFRAISAAAKVDDMPEVIGNIYETPELLNPSLEVKPLNK